jgi:hypothetical protein
VMLALCLLDGGVVKGPSHPSLKRLAGYLRGHDTNGDFSDHIVDVNNMVSGGGNSPEIPDSSTCKESLLVRPGCWRTGPDELTTLVALYQLTPYRPSKT